MKDVTACMNLHVQYTSLFTILATSLNPSRSACVHTSKKTKVFCICDSIIVQSVKVTTHRAFVYMCNWECAINIITNITHMYMYMNKWKLFTKYYMQTFLTTEVTSLRSPTMC